MFLILKNGLTQILYILVSIYDWLTKDWISLLHDDISLSVCLVIMIKYRSGIKYIYAIAPFNYLIINKKNSKISNRLSNWKNNCIWTRILSIFSKTSLLIIIIMGYSFETLIDAGILGSLKAQNEYKLDSLLLFIIVLIHYGSQKVRFV